MKPYQELTYRGKLRRIRQQAQHALEAFGIQANRIDFIRDSGNIVFRVYAANPTPPNFPEDLYYPNQFALRLHEPGYQTSAAINSELMWMAALRRDIAAPVPEPISTTQGELSVVIEIPGVPQPRRCSLVRWMKGRRLQTTPSALQLRSFGALIARLHEHAASWPRPEGFSRHPYDWQGLFGENNLTHIPAEKIWAAVPDQYRQDFETVTGQVKQIMAVWGQNPEVYGLIHADLAIGDNVLMWRGEARPLDFDDSAIGYWMFDLGVALSLWRGQNGWPQIRDAVLEGYTSIRHLPEEQIHHLDLFIATWHAFELFWASAMDVKYPQHQEHHRAWQDSAAQGIQRCLENK